MMVSGHMDHCLQLILLIIQTKPNLGTVASWGKRATINCRLAG